jgi:hypothetical protein
MRITTRLLMPAGLAMLFVGPAAAQPSEAAVAAVRSSCRSDYIAHCMGVPRGGSEALACLQRNQASLSTGCRHALAELGPVGGGAGPGLTQQCAAHLREICPGIAPGSGRLVACLADRRESLGEECRQALENARATR